MKRSFCLTVLFCLLIAALVSCGDGSVTTDVTSSTEITTPSTCVTTSVSVDDVLPESVTLSREKLTLYAGSSYSVTATVLPDHADTKAVRFSSSDETVASVSSDGTVRALRVGTAEIKATCIGGVEDSFTVTVIDESAEDYYFYSTFSADTLNPEIQIARSTNGAYEIDDGMLRLTTVDQDYINGKILFDDAIEGYLVAQASVMIETKAFSNLFYFYTSDSTTNGVVCSVAAENGYFKYHNGSSWVNLEPCHLDIFYEIEVILRIGDRVNGAEKGCFDISIDGKWYRDLPLRTGGDGVEDSIRMFFFGSNKPDTGMVYDYLYLKKAQPPYLFLNENEVELDLSKTDSYALSYELAGLPDPTVTVTSAREDGWSYQDGVLTFSKAGLYTFTLTATNTYGTQSETLTVLATSASAAPEITVMEAQTYLAFTDGCSYELSYISFPGSPQATKTLTCDKDTGYTINGDLVTFTAPGDYVFTVTLTNSVGSSSGTITVHVVTERVVFEESFDQQPQGSTLKTSGSGSVSFENGLFSVNTGSGSCAAFVDIPLSEKLSEAYTVSVDFTVNTNAFSNIMFLLADGTAPAANGGICIAVENATLKYHNGSIWVGICGITLGEKHTVTTVLDWEAGKQEIFLDGVSLGIFAVRNANNARNTTHFYLGSDKSGTDFTIDYIKVIYHNTKK